MTHHFEIGPRLWTRDGRVSGRLGVFYDRSRPQGSSVRHDATGCFAGVAVVLLPRWTLKSTFIYREPRFRHANIRHPSGARRHDYTKRFYAALAYRLRRNQEVELYYSRLDNNSNIDRFYEYEQDQVGVFYRYAF